MSEQNTERTVVRPSLKNIKRMKYVMTGSFVAIVIAAVTIVSVLAIRETDRVLKDKVSALASALNVQMKLNMDSYLSRMETLGTLAFAAPETYTYDATDPLNDEYEALQTEKIISDKLYSLCIMENFVDYGIVYRNNHPVGKISNGTVKLFGDKMFEELEGMITRKRTRDGWAAGYQDNFKRIYYVKRIHDNALLVISFYTDELERVFDNPETMSEMEIRLTNRDYNILYSNRPDEVGQPLPESIAQRVQDKSSVTVLDDEYLVTISGCGDDWNVICSVPTQIILKEKNDMQLFIFMTGLVAAVLAALVAVLLSIRITRPVERIVANLDNKAHIDQLTGVLNKRSFEDFTKDRLANALTIEKHAVILLDVDNFKGVNDTLGHACGDEVLTKIGGILRASFSSDDYLGRIGGDEFCVFLNTAPENRDDFEDYVRSKCEALCEAFRNNYTGEDGTYKISASIGAAIFQKHGTRFNELYAAADGALYQSKNRGKDTYTLAGEVET